MEFSVRSAFKAWVPPELPVPIVAENVVKPKRDKTKQPAELLRKYAKRVLVVLKSRNMYPSIQKNKVFLLLYTPSEVSKADIEKTASKFSRDELYFFIKNFFGKEAFEPNVNWDSLWAVFRRKFLKNPYIKDVPADLLFLKHNNSIKLNSIYW